MELLQLSSIRHCDMFLGWAMTMTATGAFARARMSPHWREVTRKGHFDLPCDACMELAKFTPEEYAAFLASSPGLRELWRRVITSRNPVGLLRRSRRA